MEDWEKELRERADKEVPDGAYNIGEGSGMFCWTGKGGYINFLVAIEQELRNRINETSSKS